MAAGFGGCLSESVSPLRPQRNCKKRGPAASHAGPPALAGKATGRLGPAKPRDAGESSLPRGRGLAKAGRRAGFTPDCKKRPACIACRSSCPCGESHRPPGSCEAAGRRGSPRPRRRGLEETGRRAGSTPIAKKGRPASHAGPTALVGKATGRLGPAKPWGAGKSPLPRRLDLAEAGRRAGFTPDCKKGPACIACRSSCPCGESHRPPGSCEAAGRRGSPRPRRRGLEETGRRAGSTPIAKKGRPASHAGPTALVGKATGRLGPAKPWGAGKSPLPWGLDLAEAGRRAGSNPIAKGPPRDKKGPAGIACLPACPCGESYRSSASCTGCSSYMGTPV